MGMNTLIEWAEHTFNPWRGCTKVSAGCAYCYAETLSHRNPAMLGIWGDNGTRVVASEAMWGQPLKWDQAAKDAGERHRVFCASLADVFEDREELHEPRARLFRLIEATPNLDWLLLTKRPQIAREFDEWFRLTPNAWAGTSVENQEAADERIPHLLRVPAAVRFLSVEPLLGPVEFSDVTRRSDSVSQLGKRALDGIDWVIVGGESGPKARPMNPKWVRSLRDQCVAAGVPFFFKQWGEHAPLDQVPGLFERRTTPAVGQVLRWPFGLDEMGMARVGKKAAGRLLDGRTWDELPAARSGVAR